MTSMPIDSGKATPIASAATRRTFAAAAPASATEIPKAACRQGGLPRAGAARRGPGGGVPRGGPAESARGGEEEAEGDQPARAGARHIDEHVAATDAERDAGPLESRARQ